MTNMLKKNIALILVIVLLAQCLVGCAKNNQSQSQFTNIPEQTIKETFINTKTITEENISEALILENLKYEDFAYELTIDEDFFCEAYIIEVVVDANTVETLKEQLPPDIDNYDIDWPSVIGKFAIGTAIIITVGIVHHYAKGATYFFGASPAGVAKDALVGGAIFAALNVIKNCKAGEMPKESVKKYAIEGFANGYMWSAICSVGRTVLKNLRLPSKLVFSDGSKAKIKLDGSVINSAGEAIGKAYYSNKGIFIRNLSGDAIPYLFSTKGKQIVDISATLLDVMAKGRLPANTLLQLGLEDAAQTVLTDATGKIFQVNGNLLPNITYQLGAYTYRTDSLGRIASVTFEKLTLKKLKRLPILNTIQEIGRGFQKAGDDRGHLIGDRFGGDNSLANIVAMNRELNQGAYKNMENIWADAIQNGENVSGTIELVYSESSFRPDTLKVIYSIGKETLTKLFPNL